MSTNLDSTLEIAAELSKLDLAANEAKIAQIAAKLRKYKELYEEAIGKIDAAMESLGQNKPADVPLRIVSRPQKINITPTLSMSAVVVDSFDKVQQDGFLYYVTSADHFAVRIHNNLLHGNIGTIYDGSAEKCKTINCKHRGPHLLSECQYYHDPELYEDSNERRNYTNSSLIYTPSSAPRAGIHYGSLSNIDSDIKLINSASVALLRDRTFHDLLCVLLANDYSPDKTG